jgi:hypothetical protein
VTVRYIESATQSKAKDILESDKERTRWKPRKYWARLKDGYNGRGLCLAIENPGYLEEVTGHHFPHVTVLDSGEGGDFSRTLSDFSAPVSVEVGPMALFTRNPNSKNDGTRFVQVA